MMKKDTYNQMIKSIDNTTKSFMSITPIEEYFNFNAEKKTTIQYLFLNFVLKTIINNKYRSDKEIILMLVNNYLKRSEETENYELSGLIKDLKNNFDSLYKMTTEPNIPKRTIKPKKSIDT